MQSHVGVFGLALNKLYQELQRPGVVAEWACCGCFAPFLCPHCFTCFFFFSNTSIFYPVHQVELCTLALIPIQSGHVSWYLLESHFLVVFSEPDQPNSAFLLFFSVLVACAEPLESSCRVTFAPRALFLSPGQTALPFKWNAFFCLALQQQATSAVNGDKGKESGEWDWRDW